MRRLVLTFFLSLLVMNLWAAGQQTWYTADGPIDCLPIVVPVGAHERPVYLSRTLGLLVESITCDGQPLALARKGGKMDEMARYVAKVSGTYVYTCPSSGLFFTSRVRSGDVAGDVVAYNIPAHWSDLVITFRARFADGELSDQHQARFSRLSWSEMARASVEYTKSHAGEK